MFVPIYPLRLVRTRMEGFTSKDNGYSKIYYGNSLVLSANAVLDYRHQELSEAFFGKILFPRLTAFITVPCFNGIKQEVYFFILF